MSEFEISSPEAAKALALKYPQWAPSFDNAPLSKPFLTLIARDGGRLLASASLFKDNTPLWQGMPSMTFGHLYAESPEWAKALLQKIKATAPTAMPLFGPMDANSWFSYRCVSDEGIEAPFLMEKITAPFWPECLCDAGFEAVAQYRSALTETLDYEDSAAIHWQKKWPKSGLMIRTFAGIDDLKTLYDLSIISFAKNLFYQPISFEAYQALYAPLLPYAVKDFIWLCFDGETCVGFVFAIPDLAQKMRGEAVDTLIIKTLAVRPGRAYAGLGGYLGWWVHDCARRAGLKRAIHAYMWDGNVSRVISDKSATTMRRYALYGRTA